MTGLVSGIAIALGVYVLIIFAYSHGFEAGRDHQLKIDCEARGFVFQDRICWAPPQEARLRGTL